MVAVGVVSTSKVHEDDAGGACGVSGKIVEDRLMGVGSIVTIAVAEGDFASEEGLDFGVGRGEVEDPEEVVSIGWIHSSAAVEHLRDGIDFEGDTVCEVGG